MKWGARLGQALLKAGGKCPDGKCLDAGHLVAWALWSSCILMSCGRARVALRHVPQNQSRDASVVDKTISFIIAE